MRSMRVSNPRMREIQTEMEQSDIVRSVTVNIFFRGY